MSTERPNIVLVTIDSLRADHCGFMGYEKDTTPTLDAIAEEGTVFENAIAPGPSTPESMPVVFTGQYPVAHEAGSDSGLAAYRARIRAHMAARETLPERFSRMGYTTAAFTPNPFTSRHFGFDSGFDHFQDFMDDARPGGDLYRRVFRGFLDGNTALSAVRVLLNYWQREEVFKPWETYYDEMIEWTRTADRPYFLWVFLMDAHNPYTASSEHRSQSWWKSFHANYRFWRESHETPFSDTVHDRLVTAYDDAVRYSDAMLDRLCEDLTDDDPVVVIHGDHGEAFREHGSYGHEPYLYEENVHVPLIVKDGSGRSESEPLSLARLPELLVSLATDQRRRLTEPLVVSHTDRGDRTALRGQTFKAVRERDRIDLYDVTDGERPLRGSDREELMEACRATITRWSTTRREMRLISETAGRIVADGVTDPIRERKRGEGSRA